MTPTQCKMARVALGWTGADLAKASRVGSATVARFELGKDVADESRSKMVEAFEAAGVQFINSDARSGVTVPAARGD